MQSMKEMEYYIVFWGVFKHYEWWSFAFWNLRNPFWGTSSLDDGNLIECVWGGGGEEKVSVICYYIK